MSRTIISPPSYCNDQFFVAGRANARITCSDTVGAQFTETKMSNNLVKCSVWIFSIVFRTKRTISDVRFLVLESVYVLDVRLYVLDVYFICFEYDFHKIRLILSIKSQF
jgi:hypothetical protein